MAVTQGRDGAGAEMSFQPQLVALDIDGTIVDHSQVLTDDVRAAVRRVCDAGVPVVLTTGRAWPGTETLFEGLGLPPGPSVCANGAQIIDYPPLVVRHEERFDPADTIARASRLAPEVTLAVQDGLNWRVSRPFPDGELTGNVTVESLEELASRPVSRVVLRDPGSSDDAFQRMVESLGLHEVSYFIGWSAWVDIAPLGVDKAHALALVCRDLGVAAADVLAVGDGRNDIEMLRWAGRGVAMGESPEEVRAAADHVTGGVADGGLVTELSRWFP